MNIKIKTNKSVKISTQFVISVKIDLQFFQEEFLSMLNLRKPIKQANYHFNIVKGILFSFIMATTK